MAVATQQVRVYMSTRRAGKKQLAAAVQAGISERTARRVERRGGEQVQGVRGWRTRTDPFAAVWSSEVVSTDKKI